MYGPIVVRESADQLNLDWPDGEKRGFAAGRPGGSRTVQA